MSANHNVEITIRASNLSTPEFQKVVTDLRGVGTAADQASVHVQQTGAAAKTASGGLREMSAGATTAAGSLKAIATTAAGVAIGNLMSDAVPMVIAFGKASLTAASDFQENMNKVEVVFGDAAKSITDWSEDAATAFGLSQSAALDAAGTFGNLFTSMGLGQSVAADMSQGIVQLAADLGSFNNIGTDVALEKIRAGLVGEIEPLRSLGVNINAVMVQQKAMDMGLAENAKSLTAADKAQASYALILEQTANAQGDFARTSDGLANSTKTLQANFHDLQAEIGMALIPVASDFVIVLNDAMGAAELLTGAVGDLSESLLGNRDAFAQASEKGKDWKDTVLEGRDAAVGLALDIATGTVDAVVPFGRAADDAAESTRSFHDVIMDLTKVGRDLNSVLPDSTTGAQDYATALDRLRRHGMETAQAQRELAEATSRQAEAAGLAHDGFRRTADGMIVATSRTNDFALMLELGSGTAAELAYNLDKLTDVQDDLAGAYQQGIKIQSDYNAQASEYAGQASTIEKALEIQKKRLDEGTISQEEYNRFLERGTEALGRYEGGVEDATLTAADYAIQNAELMRIQDEIQAQFPGLVQGSDEYNKKLEEAATKAGISQQAIDDMKGSNGNLAGVIANELIPALQDLINKILELDGKKATVTVETNFISTGAPGSVGFTEFAEGGLVNKPTFALIGEAGPEVVIPLNKLPASAKADIMGNQQGSGNITMGEAGWLPFVESIIGDLDKASQAFSTEGLEHAQLFAETGSTALATMVAALEFMDQMGDRALVLTETHHQSMEALNHLIYRVVELMAQDAESLNGDYLTAGQEFADVANAGVGAFLSGLEFLSSLDDNALTLTEDHHATLEAVNHLLYATVRLMMQNAESLNGPGLDAAVALSDASSAITGAMSDTLGFLMDLNESGLATMEISQDLEFVFDRLAEVVSEIADAGKDAASTWDGSVNEGLLAFADAASAGIGLLSDAVNFLTELRESGFESQEISQDLEFVFDRLAEVSGEVADAVDAASTIWDGDVNERVAAFAEAASTSLGLLGDVVDLLSAIEEAGTDTAELPQDLEFLFDRLAEISGEVADSVQMAASIWDGAVNEQLLAFTEAAGESLGVLGDVAGVMSAIGDASLDVADLPQDLEFLFDRMAEVAGEVADGVQAASSIWDASVNPQMLAFTEAAGASLELMRDLGDTLESITTFAKDGQPKNLEKLAESMAGSVSVIVQAVEQINTDWQNRGAPDIREFAEGAGAAVGLMGDAADAFEAIADGSRLSRRQVEIFQSNFRVVLDLIGDLADIAEPYQDDAERFLEVIESIAEAIGTASDLIETVAGESASSASSAAGSLSSMSSSLSGLHAKLSPPDHGGMIWDPMLGGWTDPLPDWMTAPPPAPPTPPPPGINDFLSGAAGFGTDSSHLMQMIAEAASANSILDDPLTDINETLAGIDQTFADEQVKLLQDILSNPSLYGGDMASQALVDHVAQALAESLAALGITGSTEGFINDQLAGAGVSPFEGLGDLLASSMTQAITDGAEVQGQIIGQHVAAAMRDALSGLAGGVGAIVDGKLGHLAYLHQGGL